MQQQILTNIFFYFSGIVTSYLFFNVINRNRENKQMEYLTDLYRRLVEEEEINKKNSQYIGEILNAIDIINTSIKENKKVPNAPAPRVEEVLLTETEKEELIQSEAQLVLKEWLLGGEEL